MNVFSAENFFPGLLQEESVDPLRMNGLVHIGTSGFSFEDWRGELYPDRLPRNRWLEYYARQFPTVEINATYYRIPPVGSFETMNNCTPDSFKFWVKLPKSATHGKGDFTAELIAFWKSLEPLCDSGKLVGTLAQFPFSFKSDSENRTRIERLLEENHGYPLAVEYRSIDWQNSKTWEWMENCGLINVVVDLPSIRGLPDRRMSISGGIAYVRYHGRNGTTWYHPENGDRYDYLYSEREIKEWLPEIIQMDGEVSTSYLFFNNCHAGQAVKNARMLRELLEFEFNLEH